MSPSLRYIAIMFKPFFHLWQYMHIIIIRIYLFVYDKIRHVSSVVYECSNIRIQCNQLKSYDMDVRTYIQFRITNCGLVRFSYRWSAFGASFSNEIIELFSITNKNVSRWTLCCRRSNGERSSWKTRFY